MIPTTLSLSGKELLKQYFLGERNFSNIEIKKAQLQGAILRKICFRNVTLTDVDLREADLSGADLRGCELNRVNLTSANLNESYLKETSLTNANLNYAQINRSYLKQANLQGAYLSQASLEGSVLTEANLEGAHLNQANLTKARLKRANLTNAFLTGASLTQAIITEANLCGAALTGVNFHDAYVKNAVYDDQTSFDENFNPQSAGMYKYKLLTVQELISIFEYIIQQSEKYLGNHLAIKYFESSRPNNCSWLNNFKISSDDGKIRFETNSTEPINQINLRYSQQWLENFIKSSSQIINNFSDLIDKNFLKI